MFICSTPVDKMAITPLRHWFLGLMFLFLGFMLNYSLYHYSKKWFASSSYPNFERRRKLSRSLNQLV